MGILPGTTAGDDLVDSVSQCVQALSTSQGTWYVLGNPHLLAPSSQGCQASLVLEHPCLGPTPGLSGAYSCPFADTVNRPMDYVPIVAFVNVKQT